jgi:hypothetical protein
MGAAPEVWHLRGEAGDVVAYELPLPEGIPGRLRSGAIQRVNPDGSLWAGVDDTPAAPTSLAELKADQERAANARDLPPVERPDQSARKQAWVTYAVSQGMTQAAASDLTKDELIARYGG